MAALDFNPERLTKRFLTRLRVRRGTRHPAIVLGGSVGALSYARSLGRQQIPVLILESERYAGIHTRYATVLILPSLHRHEDFWQEILEFVGARLDTPGVLFPTSDATCLFVARHEESLARYFRFIMPTRVTLERILDKRLQYETAEATGISVPRVHFPESTSDLSALGNSLTYPCLLKPRQSHIARQSLSGKVVIVHSAAELEETFAILSDRLSLMVQEIVPGGDDLLFGYLAFWDADQREVAWVTKQKLRQFPPQFGDGSLQRTVRAPEVLALSRRLLAAFGYRGFVGVEFKFDTRGGGFQLIEINPRTVSGNQLAITAGVDFPWIGYRYLTGIKSVGDSSAGFREGVQYINELWDLQACLLLQPSRTIAVGTWIRSVRESESKALGAWDDPLPLVMSMGRFLGSQVRKRRASIPTAQP